MIEVKWVKWGLVLLLGASSFLTNGPQVEALTVKSLTMQEAMAQGVKISAVLRDARTDILQKKIELEQAQHAVKSEEAKASGLFAKPRNLSQDLLTQLKVPEASKGLYLAQETLRQSMNAVQIDVQKAYLTTYQDAAAEEQARKRWEEAKTAVDTVKKKRKFGLADAAEQEKADTALEKASSSYKQAQLSAKSSRLALGKLLNIEMENKVELSFEPDYADLKQDKLPAYIASALKSTVNLLKDSEVRRLADNKLNTTRNLYSSKFGSARMKVMDGMYKLQDVDMELFMASYETTLAQVKKDWEGFFLLLGVIPIPKSLLQGEFDGLRYLNDLRDALPIATMEQNKAVLQEKESRTAVIAAVRQSFLEAKGAEEGYAQALRDRDNAKTNLDKATQKVKLSLMKTEELPTFQEAVVTADRQILAAQVSYKTALGKLDLDTGGTVGQTLTKGILPYRNLDDGLAAVKPQKPQAPVGTWKLKPAVGPLLSDFSLKVNKKLGATEYAVFTKDGHPIGKRTKLKKSVRNLTLRFSQIDNLKVNLYQKGKKIAEFALEGKGNSGQLAAAVNNEAGTDSGETAAEDTGLGKVIIGSYKVQLEALTPAAYNAAAATMAKSGQGVFYQSAEPGAGWFGLDNAVDPSVLTDSGRSAALSKEESAALKVTVEITKPGAIAATETPAQLQQQIDALKKDIVKLEAAKAAAVTDMKLTEIADLAVQLKDAQAQLGMAEALLAGDAGAALKQIELVNNPDALIAALAEEGAAPPAEPGGGAETAASEDQLAEQSELQQVKLEQAIAAGDASAAAAALLPLLATQAQLADAQAGASEGVASLAAAKQKLQAALREAQAQQDAERVATLTRSLAAVDEAAQSMQKDALFAQLDAVQELAASLPLDSSVQPLLEQQVNKLLGQLQQQEKAKYSAEELQKLADLAAALAQTTAIPEDLDVSIRPIAAENVFSPNIFIKFDAPPVIINGQAYLPIRSVSESFGAAVDWEQESMTVTVSSDYAAITCQINNATAYIDGEPFQIEAPALLLEGKTYVPLRFISESLGLQVEWNAPTQIIQIAN
ncbi:hypothetical protein GCM10008018_18740 [Paenibacillus marchantiophytorum]|uniref:Copper amine oxidase-like N-terminal domain-containing protein n=1 Tax=Paenibacillus marchantiophytorum TaxID=1619310 RepID=A0ABQ2BUM7_9BACL|nr:stalk domain-containing protein [Paenibacillus marchantiophytorum]GGI46771.1 hypothetical protein GCM10008018_18740 [Paenibacillus marchantiophytorum]